MKLSVRKRKIIIELCQEALDKQHKDKTLNQNLRSIQRNMRASINSTNITNHKQ